MYRVSNQHSMNSFDCPEAFFFNPINLMTSNYIQRSPWLSFPQEGYFIWFQFLVFHSNRYLCPWMVKIAIFFILPPSHPSHLSLPEANLFPYGRLMLSPGIQTSFLAVLCDCQVTACSTSSYTTLYLSLMISAVEEVGLTWVSTIMPFFSSTFFEYRFSQRWFDLYHLRKDPCRFGIRVSLLQDPSLDTH